MQKSGAAGVPVLISPSEPNDLECGKCSAEERGVMAVAVDEASQLRAYGVERRHDGLIYWKSDSTDHPRNWSTVRKVFDTAVIIALEFYTTVISTTGASVADTAGPEYGFERRQALVAFTFMYQLGQAIGGCLIPPFSEVVGRRLPYLVSCAVFSIFCILTAVVPSPSLIYIGRFVTGFASAAPSVVIAGSVEDIFNAKRRVWVVVLWNVGTTMGLCFGPVYATYITAMAGWRWVFYSAAIVTGVLFAALLAIKESRSSMLLGRKILHIQRHTKISDLSWHNPDYSPHFRALLDVVVVRPVTLLVTEPLVIMVAAISAVSWGIIYLFTESLATIYGSIGFTKTQASLPFLAVALGTLLTLIPRFWDMRVVRARQQKRELIQPEDKIMGFAFAAPALAIGLTWFALTVPPLVTGLHWIVPTLALIPIGFAVNELAYTLSGYLSDSYLLYSASAFSGLAFVRAIVSGLMPLIADAMYTGLNSNIAGSILAAISAAFCVVPWVFFRYSRKLRQRSPFACFSLETHRRTQVEMD
ncbi:putative transporter [Tolypocladium ophioglossoides CBS 100239]|uniref:Putative transporter n=1 Tax=Tolypocladium ophioglossoides (strain CBS 100239) TaxID=1163406 RepID=A0A0L0MZ05_TOLOC|nr:putative transporter [Tolypocladium ophioglossoides CBS 100239]